jgi:diketogulonate reductase-like aldo/keto reductase
MNVSYTEQELMLADKEKESKYIIEKILKKKQVKKINYYLIKWKNYKIKDATWEKEDKLIEDGLQKMIDDFNRAIVAD